MTRHWTTADDLGLLDRAKNQSLTLDGDAELQARVRALRSDSAALIVASELHFEISFEPVALSANASKGNICRIHVDGRRLICTLGSEVREKLQRKAQLGVEESTLQRLFTAWTILAHSFRNGSSEALFHLDFSDLAQHSGPCLAFCSNRPGDCLVPDPFFLMDFGYLSQQRKMQALPPWSDRQPDVFWRGSTSGLGPFNSTDRFFYLPRLASALPEERQDIGFSRITPRVAREMSDHERTALDELKLVKPPVPKQEFANHRYLLDIDGNSNSWGGLYSNLLTGSLVIKCESRGGFRQWYYDRLQHLGNCFMLDADLGNLPQLLDLLANDQLSAEIGSQGRQFASGLTMMGELERAKASLLGWLEHGNNAI